MPVDDWTRVEAGIFHDFHHEWISTIRRALNSGLLPPQYYALAELQAAGVGPDVLTLQGPSTATDETVPTGELPQSTIVVRHVSGDRMVAVVEVLSPGNKASKNAFRALLDKACELLEHKIHLLILDLFPPTKRDPHGLHAALWDILADEEFVPPADKPLTLAAYEAGLTVKAHIEPVAVGDQLPDMPLYLEPGAYLLLPLEATYREAFASMPPRWRRVLEAAPS